LGSVPANAVPGREGNHSKGMDMVGYSRDGKASNLPIVLTDSTLISIRKQGHSIITYQGLQQVSMHERRRYWKDFNYMHLDPKLWDEKEKHLNKKYKRGDLIHEVLIEVLISNRATYKSQYFSRS
jgi:hypothetical protein